jgi:hypothetical protein
MPGDGQVPLQKYAAAGELAPGGDPEIGQIFRSMRSVMKVSRETIARRLATTPSIIDSFEAGVIAALPRWQETARITRGYCELLRMDPGPILFRIHDRLSAAANPASANADFARPPTGKAGGWPRRGARPAAEDGLTESHSKSRRPTRRRLAYLLLAVGAPVAAVAGAAILIFVAPGPIYAAVSLLPGPIRQPAHAALDRVLVLAAPSREGLRWIEYGDPRLRKADKLRTSKP